MASTVFCERIPCVGRSQGRDTGDKRGRGCDRLVVIYGCRDEVRGEKTVPRSEQNERKGTGRKRRVAPEGVRSILSLKACLDAAEF